jgi:hypothetical protein
MSFLERPLPLKGYGTPAGAWSKDDLPKDDILELPSRTPIFYATDPEYPPAMWELGLAPEAD